MLKSYWDDDYGDRRQELVFIGTGMDEADLTRQLDDCLVPASDMAMAVEDWKELSDPFPVWKRQTA